MEGLDPSKFHTIPMKHRKKLIIGGIFLILVVLPGLFFSYYNFALNRPAQGLKEASFEIIEGESVGSVAERLNGEELINSTFLFKVYLISQNLHTKIQAGTYRIPAGSSIKELSVLFQHGTNDVHITFPEGLRTEEIALLMDEGFGREDYIRFVSLAKGSEGYLFPDTYFFNAEATEEEIIEILRSTFDEKTEDVLTTQNLQKVGLTKEEAVIFASIIEREVFEEKDRPIIAGILIKRWRVGALLGADATTQYAVATNMVCEPADLACPDNAQALLVDWWPKDLTPNDLNYDSPFNTRKNAGLPPTPISNPGLSAIEAVLNYRETPYNYYLTDPDGVTHYAETLEEHNENVFRFL